MLTISDPLRSGSVRYYNDTARAAAAADMDRRRAGGGLGEYYTEGDTRAPVWIGVGDTEKLAELTGLSTADLAGGEADMDVVGRWLEDGIAPNGASGRRYGKKSTRGFDLVFCAPKSVSLLRALSTDDVVVKALTEAHHTAVHAGMEYLATHAGYTRVHNRDNGEKDLVKLPGLVAAAYQHETSREGDPHLHSHVILFNKQGRDDGEMVSYDSKSLHDESRAAGMVYQATLRAEMHRLASLEMGKIDPSTGLGDIAGVPRDLIDAASQRSTQLREWAHEHLVVTDDHRLTAGQLSAAQKATRPSKPEHKPWAELRQEWADRFGALEVDQAAQLKARREREAVTVTVGQIARQAAATIDKPAFTRADLIEAIGARLPAVVEGAPFGPREQLEVLADNVGMRITETRKPHQRERNEHYTVAPIIAEEAAVLGLIGARNDRTTLPDSALELDELSPEQARVIGNIARSPWLIQTLSAPAGAGKTHSLRALREGVHRANPKGQVLVLAPTGKAVDEAVRECAGDVGYTVDKVLWGLRRGTFTLDPDALVIIDEAGMVGTPKLRQLYAATTQAGIKALSVGDPYQLTPVKDRGGMFEQLCNDLPWAQELTEVWRMNDPAERTASLALRHGGGSARRRAVEWYRRNDRLHIGDELAMSQDAFDAYNRSIAEGKEALIAADRWEVCDALNIRIHNQNLTEGAPIVPAARGHHIAAGDIIISRKNSDTIDVYDPVDNAKKVAEQVRNGQRWQVLRVDPKTNRIAARRIGDKARTVFEGDYLTQHVHLGYAVTIQASQGATIDGDCHEILSRTGDRAKAYVGMTRAKHENHVYIYEKTPGERDHEHAEFNSSVHLARRGDSREAAAALREILGRDDRPQTILAATAAVDPAHLPAPVLAHKKDYEATLDACRTEHRRHTEVAADLHALAEEVDYLAAAGHHRSAVTYWRKPTEAWAHLDDSTRAAVRTISASAPSIQVLTVHPDGDKSAALNAIHASAQANNCSVLAVPATKRALNFVKENAYSDRWSTAGRYREQLDTGKRTAPEKGALVVIDDADHLDVEHLRFFTDQAAQTDTKLLLIRSASSQREPEHTLVKALADTLPWAQELGTPAPHAKSQHTAMERVAEHLHEHRLTNHDRTTAAELLSRTTAPQWDQSAPVVDVEMLRAEVDSLHAAGGVSAAAAYAPPADRYASVPEQDRRAVASVAAAPQSVQVLTIGTGADKATALSAIADAARGDHHKVLALPVTDDAKTFYAEHPYADGYNTPTVAHDTLAAGEVTLPAGTLLVVDDADQLAANQVRYFTEHAANTKTKLLLVNNAATEREPRQSVVEELATHLPWAQQIGTVADREPTTQIEQARHLTVPDPALEDPTNRQEALDLATRHGNITREYRSRAASLNRTSRSIARNQERSQDRSSGYEL